MAGPLPSPPLLMALMARPFREELFLRRPLGIYALSFLSPHFTLFCMLLFCS